MGEENIGWDQSVATYPGDRLVARIGAKPWLYVQLTPIFYVHGNTITPNEF